MEQHDKACAPAFHHAGSTGSSITLYQGYFSKQFQETIGITPMQYRKQFGGRSVGKNK